MNTAFLNPFIRYCSLHSASSKHYSSERMCYDCRVFYFLSGNGSLICDGVEYIISSKNLIFLPPKSNYKFFFGKDTVNVVVIDFDTVSDFYTTTESLKISTPEEFDESKVPSYSPVDGLEKPAICLIPEAEGLLLKCCDLFLQKPLLYREKASALLKSCLLELIHKSSYQGQYAALCDKVMEYVKTNYSNTALSNSFLAEQFGYHPFHLSKIMKIETGKSLHETLVDYRITMAKSMLISTVLSIEEISWKCGFSSVAYFIRIFREKNNTTPKQYRKQVMNMGL